MKCPNCGGDYQSDLIKCPYCGTINEEGLRLAREVQTYDKDFAANRDELLATGTTKTLKKITFGVICSFMIILLLFGIYVFTYNYRYGDDSRYNVQGARYEKNKKLLKQYMEDGDYIRAFTLAKATDPTNERFEYYPEYKDELNTIFTYSNILADVNFTLDDMDNGDNYRSLTESLLISLDIFYDSNPSSVKDDLSEEIDCYLKNLYRLTDEEIDEIKNLENTYDYKIDGRGIEEVTKERMVEYFGK